MQNLFRRHIALPQDHGSWVFLFSPLLIGLFAADEFTPASLVVVIGALAAFLLRQPLTILVKVYSRRRPRTELPAAYFWLVIYGVIGLVAAGTLVYLGFLYLLYLAIPALPIFTWYLYLVSRRAERRQGGVEILATGVLALAAPATYWAGSGCPAGFGELGACAMIPISWLLWLLTWFQSAASIVHAYLRLEQRAWTFIPSARERLMVGFHALAWTTFNLALCLILGALRILPALVFLAFLLQWAETLWG